jgi:hypothetical protein
MSEKALRKCQYVLYILEAPDNLRTEILQNSSRTILNLFCEVILNVTEGNLFGEDFLFKYKKECKSILRKSESLKKKSTFVAKLPLDFFADLIIIIKKYV